MAPLQHWLENKQIPLGPWQSEHVAASQLSEPTHSPSAVVVQHIWPSWPQPDGGETHVCEVPSQMSVLLQTLCVQQASPSPPHSVSTMQDPPTHLRAPEQELSSQQGVPSSPQGGSWPQVFVAIMQTSEPLMQGFAPWQHG